jgi:hypothetical protein
VRARRFVRRHWLRLTITAVLTGLTINAWVQVGTAAFMVLAFASIGCALVLLLTGLAAGTSLVRSERKQPLAIAAREAARRAVKELSR